jgi:hypothetical protein
MLNISLLGNSFIFIDDTYTYNLYKYIFMPVVLDRGLMLTWRERKGTEGQTTTYKILNGELKIEQH